MISIAKHARQIRRYLAVLCGKDISFPVQVSRKTLTLGNPGANWTVLPELERNSIIYSCGVGEDISFDLALIKRFGVCVHAFDPTPKSVAWVKSQAIPPEFILHEYGISGEDGTAKFSPPSNSAYVSHSITTNKSGSVIELPVRKLTSIMKCLSHDHIDLLKLDVEGAEFDVVDDLLAAKVQVRQLLVEVHHRLPGMGIARTKRAVSGLIDAGFRIFAVSPSGEEYSFVFEP